MSFSDIANLLHGTGLILCSLGKSRDRNVILCYPLYRAADERVMRQLCVERTQASKERGRRLDPVITLGIEHVLLIVKGLDLSPRLPVSQWSVLREEEAA